MATSQEGLEEYKKHFQKIEYFKQNLKPKLQSDSAFRKQIFEARRLVKRTVTQLQYKHNVIFEKVSISTDLFLNNVLIFFYSIL